ncbi:MAG TPA: SDR family oxidoreductase [Bellilinea sp.]|nr:SDR family oxidoreductase [Bellilinea sp.]
MERPLKGQCFLVTGAAKRVGKAIAIALATDGANICLHYNSSEDEAKETASELEGLGVRVFLVKADLQDLNNAENIVEACWRFAPLSGLINNASVFPSTPLENETPATFEEVMRVNYAAPLFLSQAFARQLDGIHGVIINLLDFRFAKTDLTHFAYGQSKAALAKLTSTLAIALAPSIRVNAIALGAILPPTPPFDEAQILKKVPMKRWGELEEVTDAIRFLTYRQSSITGSIIHIDGGRHLNSSE